MSCPSSASHVADSSRDTGRVAAWLVTALVAEQSLVGALSVGWVGISVAVKHLSGTTTLPNSTVANQLPTRPL
jgi:hypothetical protein